jgi:hypothetical protein
MTASAGDRRVLRRDHYSQPEADRYHQQYLYKVPNGYCGISGTGVSCPVGLTIGEAERRTGCPTAVWPVCIFLVRRP